METKRDCQWHRYWVIFLRVKCDSDVAEGIGCPHSAFGTPFDHFILFRAKASHLMLDLRLISVSSSVPFGCCRLCLAARSGPLRAAPGRATLPCQLVLCGSAGAPARRRSVSFSSQLFSCVVSSVPSRRVVWNAREWWCVFMWVRRLQWSPSVTLAPCCLWARLPLQRSSR